MADAGRILIIPKGNYDASVAYEMLDMVLHNDVSWIAKTDVIGVEPSDENSTYWARMTSSTLGGETAEEWQAKIDNIKNGTTPAGNSAKLQDLTAKQVGESGAKNLIPYPYYTESQTSDGVEFITNADGTVIVNGTADISTAMVLLSDYELFAGTYTLSGCPSGGGDVSYHLRVRSGDEVIGEDTGEGFTFTLDETTIITIEARTYTGYALENIVFKPMLERGGVVHDYVPYNVGGAEHALNAEMLGGIPADEYVIKSDTLTFKDVYVLPTAWVADTTYDDYPYKANVTCEGVTAEHIPFVNFTLDDLMSERYSPTCNTGNGIITIYASEMPAEELMIPSIACIKGGV